MKNYFSSRFNNEKGVTLVMVMMVMIVLSVLGMGILGMAVNNTYLTSAERDYQSAYYIAEAGVAKEFSSIEKAVTEYYASSAAPVFFGKLEAEILGTTPVYDDFEQSFGEFPTAVVTVTKGEKLSDTSQKYRISSQGTIGQRKRTVECDIIINWQDGRNLKIPTDIAVYTNKTIKLEGSARIHGNTGTNLAGQGTITLTGSAKINNGKLYVPFGSESTAVSTEKSGSVKSEVVGKDPIVMELPAFPEFPDFPALKNKVVSNVNSKAVRLIENNKLLIDGQTKSVVWGIEDNLYLDRITIASDETLTIDTGSSDKAITVKNLDIQSGNIKITGSGKLTMYVQDNFYPWSGSLNGQGDEHKLVMYIKGNNQEINLSSNFKMAASLYAENANFLLEGSGVFKGYILTGGQSINIGGSNENTSLIFAPYADAKLLGGRVDGSIFSNTFFGDGSSEVNFKEVDYSKIPFGSGSGEEADPVDMIVTEPITEVSKQ